MKKLYDSRRSGLKILDTYTLSECDGGVGKTAYTAKNGKFYLEVFETEGIAFFVLGKNELPSALAEIEELKSV